jgi:hypothetical protein
MQFIRLDTHELIENIVHAHFEFNPGDHTWCTVTLLHLQASGQISHEAHTFDNPIIDLQVTVREASEGRGNDDVKQSLLAWAGLHRGKEIANSVMPRFHEIIDTL